MAKNIVICCDGTSNEFAKDHTNVVKLFWCLDHANPDAQVAYYHPGVGTMEPPGAFTSVSTALTKLAGLAFGAFLLNDVRDAYVFLMNTYEPDDRVFVFGFSRGAYTARALASLLHLYGLIRRGNESLVPYALRMMSATNNAGRGSKKQQAAANTIFDQAREFRATFSVPCKLHFVGVWDTVSSVGWVTSPFHAPYTATNPDIAHGRHAMAMDEKRGFFPVSRWYPRAPEAGPLDVKQVWFAGDHCDVGGGHPEADCALSKIPLEWMVCEAVAQGLSVNRNLFDQVMGYAPVRNDYLGKDTWPFTKPSPAPKPHNSINLTSGMGWFWTVAELFPRRKYNAKTNKWQLYWRPFGHKRVVPPQGDGEAQPVVHEAAHLRGADYCRDLPAGVTFAKTDYPPQLRGTETEKARNPWVA